MSTWLKDLVGWNQLSLDEYRITEELGAALAPGVVSRLCFTYVIIMTKLCKLRESAEEALSWVTFCDLDLETVVYGSQIPINTSYPTIYM